MHADFAANTVQTLIAAIPDQRLRALVTEILAAVVRCLTAETAASAPDPVPDNGRRRRSRDKARAHWSQAQRDAHNAKLREQRKLAAASRSQRRSHRPKIASENKTSAGDGTSGNGTGSGQVSAKALWKQAAKLEPKAPWRAVVRELGVPEGAAQNAHRDGALRTLSVEEIRHQSVLSPGGPSTAAQSTSHIGSRQRNSRIQNVSGLSQGLAGHPAAG